MSAHEFHFLPGATPEKAALRELVCHLTDQQPRFGYACAKDLPIGIEQALTVAAAEPDLIAEEFRCIDVLAFERYLREGKWDMVLARLQAVIITAARDFLHYEVICEDERREEYEREYGAFDHKADAARV